MKKKICLVSPSLRGGGMERVGALLANHISEQHQIEVSIVLLSRQPHFYSINPSIQVFEPDFDKSEFGNLKYLQKLGKYLRSTIKALKPEVVLCIGESYGAFTKLALAFSGLRIYLSNRASPLSSLKGFRGIINPIIHPFADGVIVQTKEAVRILSKRFKFTKFMVIGNPFELISDSKPLSQRQKIITNIGYLGGRKNQHFLINYFKELECSSEWLLQIIGDGPDKSKLEEMINNSGLQKQVILLGARKDVAELLQNSMIFAFASTSEGFPNALGEAMAAGCACISFDCITGPSELIQDGINGFLVPVGDHEQYKQKLQQLIDDGDLRERFGREARRTIEENFSIEKIGKKYLEILLPNHAWSQFNK